MDAIKGKLTQFIQKYKYVMIVLAAGILLMLIPNKQDISLPAAEEDSKPKESSVEDRLSDILSEIQGAGKCKVLLTVLSGEEILYQTNGDIQHGDHPSEQKDTVTITDANRNETGLVRQINPPVYLGAVILCQGADDPSIRLAIADAVSKATGLGIDKISVLKMK